MSQRRLPSKRYSSYVPPSELSTLGDQVSRMHDSPDTSTEAKNCPTMRTVSASESEKVLRRRSLNTLHFDALQSAVSKLSRIDDFHLEELGYGFFSDVFKVTHKQSGKVMVLKRNKNTNTKLNILREVQLMNRLSHPNILKFMGVCVHEGQLHALTEFINGGDLDQLVQRKSDYLSWKTRISLAADISKGLCYLHTMGIFHRDLTAKNCLVRTTHAKDKIRYTAILADLGLAEKIPSTPEERARLKMVGTPYCMAPEVLCDKRYDERSDLFSFGLIICQLIIRTSMEPEKLPRSNDFGLARDLFQILVKQGVGCPEENMTDMQPSMPPASFLQLAFDCCEVEPLNRPGIKDIVQRLEKTYADEKLKLFEEKRPNGQGAVKRHSSALTELLSQSDANEASPTSKAAVITSAVVSDSNKENLQTNIGAQDNLPSEGAADSSGSRRFSATSCSSRLSRSSSDISTELISHAASMIASSQGRRSAEEDKIHFSSILSSLEAFMNPFTTLEKPEIQEPKLFDVPSSEVLEMTFDLPAQKLPPGSPSRTRRLRSLSQRRSQRPSSLVLDIPTEKTTQQVSQKSAAVVRLSIPSLSPEALTPEPSCGVPNLLRGEDKAYRPSSVPSTPVLAPETPDFSGGADSTDFQGRQRQALLRAMALSPRGCRLLAWWHSHGRKADLRSLASLLSVMAEKLGNIRKSISLPDLSQDSSQFVLHHRIFTPRCSQTSVSSEKSNSSTQSDQKPPIPSRHQQLGHPPYATLPRKSKSRSRSTAQDHGSKRRSRTSDDVFQDPNLLEILHEETGDAKACGVILQSCNIAEYQGNLDSSSHLDAPVQDTSSQDDDVGSDEIRFLPPPIPPHHPQADHPPGHHDISSSSSSSGTSSTGLQITIQTGMVSSSRRRRRQECVPSKPRLSGSPLPSCYRNRDPRPHSCDSLPNSLADSFPTGDVRTKSKPGNEDEKSVDVVPPKSNRDSGYEEILSPEHSCGSHYYDFHRCENVNNNVRPFAVQNLNTLPNDHTKCVAGPTASFCKVRDCNGNEALLPLVSDSR